MKRFLLITINWYNANGGIGDVESSVDTDKEALEWLNNQIKKGWHSVSYQIFDCEKREIVHSFHSEH